MPLETNLSRNPYFNDYEETKDYYGILYKPSVAVQARELNQMQTILQKQIERFGDHVFKSGTIISGVNFRYLPNYQYIKILDLQVDLQPVTPVTYEGLFVRNSSNLVARVVKSASGFQQKDPDLNTLYLQYINSSTTGNTSVYANGEVLTVYSKDYPLYSVQVNNGGLNFSNSDAVIVVSALGIDPTTGVFSNGEVVTQATTGARAQIVGVDNSTIANTTVLQVKPLNADLANTAANTSKWTFAAGYNITGDSSGAVANVTSLVGSGAAGVVTTDSLGVITKITVNAGGNNYIVAPHVTVKPISAAATISNLSLTGRNYKTQITIANSSFTAPVGNGYAFATTEGVIYQKGYFLRVDPQVVIVDKYSDAPDGVAVGFKTNESIANANIDSSLYDNALNTSNFAAPGADRLKLTPELVVIDTAAAAANVEFFTLAEFKNGAAYKENRNTVYNTLGKEFARRTSEASGDFVIDEFLVVARDKDTANTTHNQIFVDPGLAYISGERVQTLKNTYTDIRKSTDTLFKNNQIITANYGNYVRVNEFAGNFNFKAGDTVTLLDTAQTFVSSLTLPTGTSITPNGNAIGTARIRSMVFESGEAGTPSAVYRLYLFNINMSAGKSFKDVKAFYYDSTNDGICDAVQEFNALSNSFETLLKDTDNNNLIFATGLNSLKTANDVSFTYRTSNEAAVLNANGMLTLSLIAVGEQFPYTADASLSTEQKQDIVLTPLANVEAAANLTGTVAAVDTSPVLTGTATSFTVDLAVGDYIKIAANSTASDVRRVVGIANATSITVDSNVAFSNTSARVKKFFPAFYPISIATRSNRIINVGSTSTTLKIHLNENLASTTTAMVNYNVRRTSAVESTKAVHRDTYVKIYTGNNAAGSTGPWCLGLPDAIRLKNVYLGNTSSDLDVTKHFYIDQGHDGNYYGPSYLVKRGNSTLAISNTQWLLVKFDNLTPSAEGFLTVSSYNIDDSKTLAASSNTINIVEIPEVITADKKYYDLRDAFDFRPYTANTVAIASVDTNAPVNPSSAENFNLNDKLFPAPDSEIVFDAEYYLARTDRVVAKKDGSFEVLEGVPSAVLPYPPRKPSESITLSVLTSPPYPSLPVALNDTNAEFVNKAVGNEQGEINTRIGLYTTFQSTANFEQPGQTRAYKMEDIDTLSKRLDKLEYYVSLNLLEQSVKDLVIPSSANGAINRFKNGFFVDDFESYTVAETNSREFTCTIEQSIGELQPASRQYNLNLIFDRTDGATSNSIVENTSIMLPYTEEILVRQSLATSTINSDGKKINYAGDMQIAPSTFKILVRGEVQITPDPAVGGPTYIISGGRTTILNSIVQGVAAYGLGQLGFGIVTAAALAAPVVKVATNIVRSIGKIFSDERLKTDVELVGKIDGINIYSFKYVWDKSTTHVGVMAQELINTRHQYAITKHENGYYMVDYNKLPYTVQRAILDI